MDFPHCFAHLVEILRTRLVEACILDMHALDTDWATCTWLRNDVSHVSFQDNQKVGIGSGSTIVFAVERLGKKV